MSDILGEAVRQAGYSQAGYVRAAEQAKKAEAERDEVREMLDSAHREVARLSRRIEHLERAIKGCAGPCFFALKGEE